MGELSDEELSAWKCMPCEEFHSVTERYLIPSTIVYHNWDVRIRLYEQTGAFMSSVYVLPLPAGTSSLEDEFVSITGGILQ